MARQEISAPCIISLATASDVRCADGPMTESSMGSDDAMPPTNGPAATATSVEPATIAADIAMRAGSSHCCAAACLGRGSGESGHVSRPAVTSSAESAAVSRMLSMTVARIAAGAEQVRAAASVASGRRPGASLP